MKRQRTSRTYLVSALVLIGLTYAVRLHGITAASLWYDETFTLYHAQQGVIAGMLGLLHEDNALPLHGVLLALWIKGAGAGEYSARYLSVLLGTLGAPLVLRLAGALSGRREGGWGAALAYAMLPICVYYAQEVRMYALALSLAAGYAWMAWRLIAGRGRSAYVVFTIAMLTAHLYTGLLWVSIWGWGALVCRLQNRQAERRWWRTNLCALLIAVPIIGWAVWRAGVDTTATSAVPMSVVNWLPMLYGVGQYLRDPWMTIFFWLSILGTLSTLVHLGAKGRWQGALWLISGLIAPIVLVLALTVFKAKWSERYLLPSFGLVWVTGIGMGWELGLRSDRPELTSRRLNMETVRRAFWAVQVLLTVAWSVIALVAVMLQARGNWVVGIRDEWRPRPDFRGVGQYLSTQSGPEDAIVVVGGYAAHTLAYYYQGSAAIFGLPPDTRLLDTHHPLDLRALTTLEQQAGPARRLWLVLWQFHLADPTNLVQSTLVERCRRLPVDRNFTNVSILLFDLTSCRPLDASIRPSVPLAARFEEPIELIGYDIIRRGETWEIDLWWETHGKLGADYTVFVHLIDDQDTLIDQHDHIAGADTYPTSQWTPGIRLRDRFFVTVPGKACQACYLRVGLYTPQQRLALQDGRDMLIIPIAP